MNERIELGQGLIRQVADALGELDTLHAHLRAVVNQGRNDPTWTGWLPAIEALLPESPARLDALGAKLRESPNTAHLADRLDALRGGTEPGASD